MCDSHDGCVVRLSLTTTRAGSSTSALYFVRRTGSFTRRSDIEHLRIGPKPGHSTGVRIAFVLLLVACGSPDDKPATRDPNFRAAVTGSLDPKLPFGNELTISAATDVTDPLRRSIETAMLVAIADAAKCMEGIYGTAPFEVELDASGKVVKAKVSSGLLEGTPIATCIEAAFGKMQIGKVSGAPIQISYPVRNLPSAQQLQDAAQLLKKL